MRWGERTPASRDELDTSFHFAHQPQREPTKASLVMKKPAPKPALTGTAIGRNMRPGKAGSLVSAELSSSTALPSKSTRAEDPATAGSSSSTTSQRPKAPSSFLVCAGKSVSSNNDDESSESAAHHHQSERCVSASNCSDPVKKAMHQSLQCSDSELELIISELQHRLDEEKRRTAAMASHKSSEVSVSGALDSSRSTGSSSEPHHPRRHLKNPIERIHGNNSQVGSLGLSMSSSSSILLKRQQSLNSVAAGNGAKLAPPTVIATGIGTSSSSSRSNLATSASVTGTLLHHSSGSIFNDRDLEAHSYSRVYDEEGLLIKSYAQEPSNNNMHTANGVQRPIVCHSNAVRVRHVRRPTTSENERKGFTLHLKPQRQSGNNGAIDSDSSFSDDDENPFLLQGALSPVGPWMVADDRQSPESLDSCNLDSHHHPSSVRFDLSPTGARSATEDEFAELSPRSRLLWFSEFADSVEYSSESFGSSSSSSFALRQCQSHPGSLQSSSTAAVSKTNTSKPPVRCSSAKLSSTSSYGRRGGAGLGGSNGVKSKSGGVQIKKRPQSGSSRARKPAV